MLTLEELKKTTGSAWHCEKCLGIFLSPEKKLDKFPECPRCNTDANIRSMKIEKALDLIAEDYMEEMIHADMTYAN